jgi:hypothetical protein
MTSGERARSSDVVALLASEHQPQRPLSTNQAKRAQTTANELFERLIAPLVLSGPLHPGRPLGGRCAFDYPQEWTPPDIDLHAQVQLARSRRARALAAVDRAGAITGTQLALAGVLSDLMLVTHPELVSLLRPRAALRLSQVARETALALPTPHTLAEAIDRHTLFGRALDAERRDVTVHWWTGHATFRGTEPPARLLAWPAARRVRQEEQSTAWAQLPVQADTKAFHDALAVWLRHSPLTDLALATRAAPEFEFSGTLTGLVAQPNGRTLALRILCANKRPSVLHDALGSALRTLIESGAFAACAPLADLFADYALREAQTAIAADAIPKQLARADTSAESLLFAFAASAALQKLGTGRGGLRDAEREQIALLLAPRTRSDEALWLAKQLR